MVDSEGFLRGCGMRKHSFVVGKGGHFFEGGVTAPAWIRPCRRYIENSNGVCS